jgi:hypothetical protein
VLKRVHEIEGVPAPAVFGLETINAALVLGVVVLGVVVLASEFAEAVPEAGLLVNIIMPDPT